MNPARRLEALERAAEWDRTVARMKRVIAWHIGTGRCDATRAAAAWADALRRHPRAAYVAGSWQPPAGFTWDDAKQAEHDALWADVEAWERTRDGATV